MRDYVPKISWSTEEKFWQQFMWLNLNKFDNPAKKICLESLRHIFKPFGFFFVEKFLGKSWGCINCGGCFIRAVSRNWKPILKTQRKPCCSWRWWWGWLGGMGRGYWWTHRIRYSYCYCCSVTDKPDVMVLAYERRSQAGPKGQKPSRRAAS